MVKTASSMMARAWSTPGRYRVGELLDTLPHRGLVHCGDIPQCLSQGLDANDIRFDLAGHLKSVVSPGLLPTSSPPVLQSRSPFDSR
ncbi:hypothetical protein AKJ16_DCAP15769 [Drosera capensis]